MEGPNIGWSPPPSDIAREYLRQSLIPEEQRGLAQPQIEELLGPAVPLNTLWRINIGGDRTSTPAPQERDSYPLEGATYYVPKGNGPGTAPLYRLYNGRDHMESAFPGEPGYQTESILGFPWPAAMPPRGTQSLIRVYNSATRDHGLRHPYETLPAYKDQRLNVFGYPRYGNRADPFIELRAGGIRLRSNRAAGGAIWSWTWNGTEFVNTWDHGREIQSALFVANVNPNEAGDTYSSPSFVPAARHGSPLEIAYNSGTTQVTRAVPLEWTPESSGGGGSNPVVWRDLLLGKDVTLNFDNMGPVAQYTTVLYTPYALTNAGMEIPTGYLRANFDTFWVYDAPSDVITQVFPPPQCPPAPPYTVVFAPEHGGVIISDGSEEHAMGVYGANTSVGGAVSYFSLWSFICDDNTAPNAYSTSKWNAVHGPGNFSAGYNTFTTWIVTADLATVRQLMHTLYLREVA